MNDKLNIPIEEPYHKITFHVIDSVYNDRMAFLPEDLIITIRRDSTLEDYSKLFKNILYWVGWTTEQINSILPDCDNCPYEEEKEAQECPCEEENGIL